jgi:hypothetical protein
MAATIIWVMMTTTPRVLIAPSDAIRRASPAEREQAEIAKRAADHAHSRCKPERGDNGRYRSVRYSVCGSFAGRLVFGETYHFKLQGASSFGNPLAVRFRGVGDAADSQGQVYDYLGYLVPLGRTVSNNVPRWWDRSSAPCRTTGAELQLGLWHLGSR